MFFLEANSFARIAIVLFISAVSFGSVAAAQAQAPAQAQNGQINGFRYYSCEATNCIVVEAPRAWLSVANGAFVAESAATSDNSTSGTAAAAMGAEHAVFRILKNQKIVREFKASEIVHRPEIGMMTIETPSEVVLFDNATYELEAVRK